MPIPAAMNRMSRKPASFARRDEAKETDQGQVVEKGKLSPAASAEGLGPPDLHEPAQRSRDGGSPESGILGACPGTRSLFALPALAVALAILLPTVVVAADQKPDFTGTWTFVQQKSDDLPAKIAAAVGPDYTVGNKKSEQVRVWIRSWLEGLPEDPRKRVLTIEQTTTEFKSGIGDEVNIYYFGREATSQGPGGGNLKVTVAWQGDQIVTEEKQAKGKGRISAVYTLQPGGRSLLVDWHLEHDSMKQPLEVRLAFDRAPQ